MYGNGMGKGLLEGLSLSKVVGGISKALGLVNQALPLYNQLKPIISNGKSLMSIVSILNKPDQLTKSTNKEVINNISSNSISSTKKVSNNLPTFFQ